MAGNVEGKIEAAIGVSVTRMGPLSGGCVGEVYRARLSDGQDVVVKVDNGANPALDIEGYMLVYLAKNSVLPTPKVLHSSPELLVMEFIEGTSRFNRNAEVHAANLLAEMHAITSEGYGLERDTLIGGLHQSNTWTSSWVEFFAEHRLLAMAKQAVDAGRMGSGTLKRIRAFTEKLGGLIEEADRPSLIHGDVWSANVLAAGDRITGFVDPALYYGHAEIELAFITLFSTFGDAFFARYEEVRGIRDGFFDLRRDIYNIYPLLVHVRLFGGGYLDGVERALERHGC